MNRARLIVGATLVGASFAGVALFAQQTSQAPPMKSVLAGKKFQPPLKGRAEIEFVQPTTKKVKDMVVTTITVKNVSNAPIPRLTVDETWFDDKQNMVTGSKGFINGLLQPGEVKTIQIETPYNPKMRANSWVFTHANGDVKPHKVKSLDVPKEPAAKNASDTKGAKPAPKATAGKKK
jgi:hypothetical protein